MCLLGIYSISLLRRVVTQGLWGGGPSAYTWTRNKNCPQPPQIIRDINVRFQQKKRRLAKGRTYKIEKYEKVKKNRKGKGTRKKKKGKRRE